MNVIAKRILRPVYYNTIREYLPRKIGVYHGIATRRPRLFDLVDVSNEYEKELIEMVKRRTKEGDTVILIGAGFGISTIVASKAAGADGHIIAYEASENRYVCAKEALDLNETPASVDLRRGIVAEGVAVKGTEVSQHISPGSLPDADLLIMDCEGAEKSILKDLEEYPDRIIVETHGCFDSPTKEVKKILDDNGHTVEDSLVESSELGIDILFTNSHKIDK